MFFSDSLKLDLLGTFVALITMVLAWHKWSLGYWKRKGIPGPQPSLFVGNAVELIQGKKCMGEIFKDVYFGLKNKGYRHGGIFFLNKANYIPVDLEITKSILQTDFQHFNSHGMYYNEDVDPLSANILSLDGERWKDIRGKCTPGFSPGKIKTMYPIMAEYSTGLKELLEDSIKHNPVDIKDIMARFSTDVVGSCAFGLEVESMKYPAAELRNYNKKLMEPSISTALRNLPSFLIPHEFLRFINYSLVPSSYINYFYNLIVNTISHREETKFVRKDILNMLMELKHKGRLTLNEVAANSYILYLGGWETTATTLTFLSYELSVNIDIQEKLRDEINTILKKHDNKMTYEAVMEMEYLDRVICETLRKYPAAQFLFRKTTKTFNIPGENTKLDEGDYIIIPTLGIHHDPDYYPDPDKFDPDRFSEENKKKRPHFAWLPFGEGPRICLGLRFGMVQIKIATITLIKNFKIALNKKTISPIKYKAAALLASSLGGVWLDLEKINK